MAFFISRIGATPVAGHQIAVNLVSLMYMLPLAVANASSTLVAQRIGAADAEARGASAGTASRSACYRRRVRRGGLLAARPDPASYTNDPVIVAAALPLLAWVALFHFADATQAVAAFVLRAYRIVNVPLRRSTPSRSGASAWAAATCSPSTSAARARRRCRAHGASGPPPRSACSPPRWRSGSCWCARFAGRACGNERRRRRPERARLRRRRLNALAAGRGSGGLAPIPFRECLFTPSTPARRCRFTEPGCSSTETTARR